MHGKKLCVKLVIYNKKTPVLRVSTPYFTYPPKVAKGILKKCDGKYVLVEAPVRYMKYASKHIKDSIY
jgi:hypothetical protein